MDVRRISTGMGLISLGAAVATSSVRPPVTCSARLLMVRLSWVMVPLWKAGPTTAIPRQRVAAR